MTSPYSALDPRHFWRTAVAAENPLAWRDIYRKRFPIEPDDRIATAGSCFAQHFAGQLSRRGFEFLDSEPGPPSLSPALRRAFGYGVFSARYGNIYTARQLLQLFQEAFGERRPAEPPWISEGRFHDPLRPAIEPEGFVSADELAALRQLAHLPAVRKVFLECNLFVFTLGLTEAWLSAEDGTVFPSCPGTIAGEFDASRHRFHNFGFKEVQADMVAFIDRLRDVNARAKVLLTVSPVPLAATATDNHVLEATTYSKSVLRAVAGSLHERFQHVDYFPSYELVTAPAARGMFFEPDLRNVTPVGVDQVMRHFFAEHPSPSVPASVDRPARRPIDDEWEEFRAVCEEARLDPSFNA